MSEDFIRVDQYTVLKVDVSGQYGVKLIEGWEGRDGDFKPNFCKREFKKGTGEKNVPVSIKLGDRNTAVNVLETILLELKEYGAQLYSQGEQLDQDVPF